MEALPCICEGNWRLIIKEYSPLFERLYKYKDVEYKFCGILHGIDDYYYCMYAEGETILLSCCLSIEQYDFELVEEE